MSSSKHGTSASANFVTLGHHQIEAVGGDLLLKSLCRNLGVSPQGQKARLDRAQVPWLKQTDAPGYRGAHVIPAEYLGVFLSGVKAPQAARAVESMRAALAANGNAESETGSCAAANDCGPGSGPDAAVVVRDVEGWALCYHVKDDEPRILDVDLGERLGYARPSDIRELIDRLANAGKIDEAEVIRSVRKTSQRGGRPANERYLTEEQALMVTTSSETPRAIALTKEIVRVFMLARRGQLPGQMAANDVAAMVTAMRPAVSEIVRAEVAKVIPEIRTVVALDIEAAAKPLRESLAVLIHNGRVSHDLLLSVDKHVDRLSKAEQRAGVISPEQHADLRDRIRVLAALMRGAGQCRNNQRAAYQFVVRKVLVEAEHLKDGNRLDNMPTEGYAKSIAYIAKEEERVNNILRARARDIVKQTREALQIGLFPDPKTKPN